MLQLLGLFLMIISLKLAVSQYSSPLAISINQLINSTDADENVADTTHAEFNTL
ncbi:MAG: hypothetical protein ACPG8W_08125 [Candidatus Promineifilaceae bacterium]